MMVGMGSRKITDEIASAFDCVAPNSHFLVERALLSDHSKIPQLGWTGCPETARGKTLALSSDLRCWRIGMIWTEQEFRPHLCADTGFRLP